MSANADWRVGEVRSKHPDGKAYVLPGWVRGFFGLDYRYGDDEAAWILTHLPTGYAAFAIQEPLRKAQQIAEEVAEWGDWDFLDPTETRRFNGRVPELRKRYPDIIRAVSEFPLRTFMVASPAQTHSEGA